MRKEVLAEFHGLNGIIANSINMKVTCFVYFDLHKKQWCYDTIGIGAIDKKENVSLTKGQFINVQIISIMKEKNFQYDKATIEYCPILNHDKGLDGHEIWGLKGIELNKIPSDLEHTDFSKIIEPYLKISNFDALYLRNEEYD